MFQSNTSLTADMIRMVLVDAMELPLMPMLRLGLMEVLAQLMRHNMVTKILLLPMYALLLLDTTLEL